MRRNKVGCITSLALVVALTSFGAAPAHADGATNVRAASAGSDPSRAVATNPSFDGRIASASDRDLLILLLTGTGPIAEAHPELPVELGFSETPMPINEQGLALVTDTFIAKYPKYMGVWSPAIKSGDPVKINQGLNGFMLDFIEFVETDEVFSDFRTAAEANQFQAQARGDLVWVWNVSVVANAAVVATTVGVAATVAAAAMAIALVGGVFVAYLDDVEGSDSSMDMKRLRESTVKALAS